MSTADYPKLVDEECTTEVAVKLTGECIDKYPLGMVRLAMRDPYLENSLLAHLFNRKIVQDHELSKQYPARLQVKPGPLLLDMSTGRDTFVLGDAHRAEIRARKLLDLANLDDFDDYPTRKAAEDELRQKVQEELSYY